MFDDLTINNLGTNLTTGISDDDLALLSTTSAKIRYLDKNGMTRANIARKLNIRYQHVKNVLDNPLKRT